MSVAFNSLLSSANLNASFVSTTADSAMSGVLSLNNSGSDTISDVQQAINDSTYKTHATQNMAGGDTINISTSQMCQYRRVQGASGAVTASTTPFGSSAPEDGTLIRLVGLSDANSVSLTHNDAAKGVILNGNCTLQRFNVITFQYDAVEDRYIEVGRNF